MPTTLLAPIRRKEIATKMEETTRKGFTEVLFLTNIIKKPYRRSKTATKKNIYYLVVGFNHLSHIQPHIGLARLLAPSRRPKKMPM